MVSVHVATKLAYSVQLAMVEHLTKLLEFILGLLCWLKTVFPIEHASKGIEICGIFHKTRDIDLSTNEVAESASGVKQGCCHE
jgi:hypothetical protein